MIIFIYMTFFGALAPFFSIFVQSISIEEAKDDRISMYQSAVELTVEISLNVSEVMSRAIDRIFAESDLVENEAVELKAEFINLSHSDITKTKCINRLNPSALLSKMSAAMPKCIYCLDKVARKCSLLEIEVTLALNHFRNHVMQGMDALDKCQPSALTYPDEFCLRTVNEELELLTDSLWTNLLSIKDKVKTAEGNVSADISKCCGTFYESVRRVKSTLNSVEECKKLINR